MGNLAEVPSHQFDDDPGLHHVAGGLVFGGQHGAGIEQVGLVPDRETVGRRVMFVGRGVVADGVVRRVLGRGGRMGVVGASGRGRTRGPLRVGVMRLTPAGHDELHEGSAITGLSVPRVDQPVAPLEGLGQVEREIIDQSVADSMDALEPEPHVVHCRLDRVAELEDGGAVGSVDVEERLDHAVVAARLVEARARVVDPADLLFRGPGIDADDVGVVVSAADRAPVESCQDGQGVHREPDVALFDRGQEDLFITRLPGSGRHEAAAVAGKGREHQGIAGGERPVDQGGDRLGGKSGDHHPARASQPAAGERDQDHDTNGDDDLPCHASDPAEVHRIRYAGPAKCEPAAPPGGDAAGR